MDRNKPPSRPMPERGPATPRQVAEFLQIHEKTVADLVDAGVLPAPIRLGHRTYRFDAARVRQVMQGGGDAKS